MNVVILPGKYILAVSGGVDSMSLLGILAKQPETKIVVAHFNHGIRSDSRLDEELVSRAANKYGLKFELGKGELGAGVSEEKARTARYEFLRAVQQKHAAKAIITAHHQDDLIETAFLNLLRGSGRLGLSAIASSDIYRPLLSTSKTEILDYARQNQLQWREDPTNQDLDYLRNYLRQKILPSLTSPQRKNLISYIDKVAKTNLKLNKEIATLSQGIKQDRTIDRLKFINLPQEVANELVASWLREVGIGDFDKKTIDRLTMALKTGQSGTSQSVRKANRLEIKQKTALFTTSDQIT